MSPNFLLTCCLVISLAAGAGHSAYALSRALRPWPLAQLLVCDCLLAFVGLPALVALWWAFILTTRLHQAWQMALIFALLIPTIGAAIFAGSKWHNHSNARPQIGEDVNPSSIVMLTATMLSLLLGLPLYLLLGFLVDFSIPLLHLLYVSTLFLSPNLTPLFLWLAQSTVHKSPLGRD